MDASSDHGNDRRAIRHLLHHGVWASGLRKAPGCFTQELPEEPLSRPLSAHNGLARESMHPAGSTGGRKEAALDERDPGAVSELCGFPSAFSAVGSCTLLEKLCRMETADEVDCPA